MKKFIEYTKNNWEALVIMAGIIGAFAVVANLIEPLKSDKNLNISIVNVNGCEYIVYHNMLAHKANCTNTVHSLTR